MGVPGCIQEDRLPEEPAHLKDKSQANYSLDFMTTP
jgi:hypothetical protein